MIDKDDFKDQVVLRFSDITSKRVKPESTNTPSETVQATRQEMEIKIATAKLHANKEMKAFQEATEEYISKIKDLVLFDTIDEIVEELLLEQLLKNLVSPAVKGTGIPGMPDEQFRTFRKDMFSALIKEYTS